jgi:hypothetical protein
MSTITEEQLREITLLAPPSAAGLEGGARMTEEAYAFYRAVTNGFADYTTTAGRKLFHQTEALPACIWCGARPEGKDNDGVFYCTDEHWRNYVSLPEYKAMLAELPAFNEQNLNIQILALQNRALELAKADDGSAMKLGRALKDVKRLMRHGEFKPWLEKVGISRNRASYAMRLANDISAKAKKQKEREKKPTVVTLKFGMLVRFQGKVWTLDHLGPADIIDDGEIAGPQYSLLVRVTPVKETPTLEEVESQPDNKRGDTVKVNGKMFRSAGTGISMWTDATGRYVTRAKTLESISTAWLKKKKKELY